MSSCDRSATSNSTGTGSLPYAVGIVLDGEDQNSLGSQEQLKPPQRFKDDNDSELGLGLSKRWGDQDCDWPVVAAAQPRKEEDAWSSNLDQEIKNRWADDYLWDLPAESSVDDKDSLLKQERMDLTQKRATKENSTMNRQLRRDVQESTRSVPGAYHVRGAGGGGGGGGGGLGGLASRFRRATVERAYNDDDDYSDYSDFELFEYRWSRTRIAVCLLCMVVVGLAIGLSIVMLAGDDDGMGLGRQSGRDGTFSGPQCNFTGTLQPDPFLQCACYGNITLITDPLITRYQDLLRVFVPLVIPDFQEYEFVTSNPTSCAPHNMALWWLALDFLSERDDLAIMTNRYVLALLYALWDGANWKHNEGWLATDEDECNWYGVQCKRPSTISGLDLRHNFLKGTMPPEIELLKDLIKLDVSGNDLDGVLPEEIYNIVTLEDLLLWDNDFEGTISESIGNLTNLKELSLDNNHFTGLLPNELSTLNKMIWFMVDLNDFQGEVFDLALNWPNLVGFTVGGNSFSGSIPSEAGALLPNIRVMDLSGNGFVGILPSELGNLVEMEEFSIDGHNLQGTIPTEIGNWENTKNLALTYGSLEGTIPTELGRMRVVENIFLGENKLTGLVPSELGLCKQLKQLGLGNNKVNGNVPSELGALNQLVSLNLGWTTVTGVAPAELCMLHEDVGGGELVSFEAPCYDFKCDPPACCTRCCTPGCS